MNKYNYLGNIEKRKITTHEDFKWIVVSFCIWIFWACSSSPQQNSHENKYQKEVDYYSQIISINPGNIEAYRKRSENYFYLKRYNEALKDLNIAIELSPLSDDLFAKRVHIYSLLGLNQDALRDANRAIELNPKDAVNNFNRGMIYYYMELYEEALNDINQAILINKNYSIFFKGRGNIYKKLAENTDNENMGDMYRQKSESDFAMVETMSSER